MVLRQNVSYDVYGTFCMESEGTNTAADPNMSRDSVVARNCILFGINTSKKIKVPLNKVV